MTEAKKNKIIKTNANEKNNIDSEIFAETVPTGATDNISEIKENERQKSDKKKTQTQSKSTAKSSKDDDITLSLSANPYSPDGKSTSDIVRLFYVYNLKILPVVSKNGMLIGILKKDDLVSELSDIERSKKHSIDKFITRLAKKMSFEELLPHAVTEKFPVINIFGEEQKAWSRLQLLSAAERGGDRPEEIRSQQNEKALEWIIYLILEHIPRALYAINDKGKTIFYNSYFENIYEAKKNADVDTDFMERSFANPGQNEPLPGGSLEEFIFYSRDLDCVYEKLPLMNKAKRVGYLMFFDKGSQVISFSEADMKSLSLEEALASAEKKFIAYKLSINKDLKTVSKELKISRQTLAGKIKKLGIDI